jgi:integrase
VIHLQLPALATLADEFRLQVLQFKAPTTYRHQGTLLRTAIRELPAQPDPRAIRSWLAGKIESGDICGASANNYLAVLRRCYSLATDNYGVPNMLSGVEDFPTTAKRPRAIPNDSAGGRLAYVMKWQAVACRDDVERAFLAFLFGSGLRVGEALAVTLDALDLTGLRVDVRAQRAPDAEEVTPRCKTKGSHAIVSITSDAAQWIERALRAPERMRWGGHWKGWQKRARLAARYVFPFNNVQLRHLLSRLRAVDPACFPRRVKGAQSGDAWHVFRHSLASDLCDAAEAAGTDPLLAVQRQLRHKHDAWSRDYVASLRGRDQSQDLGALEAARAAQRTAVEAAAGVPRIGKGLGNDDDAGSARGVAGLAARRDAGAAQSERGGRVDLVARSGVPVVPGVLTQNTGHVSPLSQHTGRGAMVSANAVGSKGLGWRSSSQVSTHHSADRNTSDDPASPAPSAAPTSVQRGLPLGPIGLARSPRSRKGGRK